MRNISLLIAVLGLAGCAGDIPHTVAFANPVTKATASCNATPLADINPWSQFDLCVENYKAEGWVVVKN
jgi:uncharacterized protein YceK